MTNTINDERLNDFVDGLLPADEAAEVERYLQSSPEARDTVAFLRSLRDEASRLPESIEPGRDLWPEISSRMAPAPLAPVDSELHIEPPARATWWPSLGGAQWGALAAAAMLLMVFSSALTAWFVGMPPAAGEVVTPAGASVALETAPVGAAYALEIDALRSELDANRSNLDPDTVSTIETNLRVIDRAIRRAREALDDDPNNAGLARMLDNNYRHKLQLLQRANRIMARS